MIAVSGGCVGRRLGTLVGVGVAVAALAAPGRLSAQSGTVTFTRDVAPIMQENCVSCHRENSIAPMSLRTYQDARRYASMIRELVTRRLMPPYHYDHDVGIQQIQGDWRLSEEEIQTIASWVDTGAPEGDPAEMPAQREFEPYDSWQMENVVGRAPDLVIESTPFDVPAEGGDLWWRPVVDIPIDRDRKVRAIETRPTYPEGVQVVHHGNVKLVTQDPETGLWDAGGNYSEYAMGKVGELFPPDAYRILPAGAALQFDIHYYPGGSSQGRGEKIVANDNVLRTAFWFYDEDEAPDFRQELKSYQLEGDILLEPGGTAMTQGFHVLDHPIRIDQFQAHGHVHLHAMKAHAIYPDGRQETLAMTTNFNAMWHHSYIYERDSAPLLPKGTVLVLTGWYDNTEDNPLATDPNTPVARGNRTTDEMSHAWIGITHLTEEGYQRLKAEREARMVATAQED